MWIHWNIFRYEIFVFWLTSFSLTRCKPDAIMNESLVFRFCFRLELCFSPHTTALWISFCVSQKNSQQHSIQVVSVFIVSWNWQLIVCAWSGVVVATVADTTKRFNNWRRTEFRNPVQRALPDSNDSAIQYTWPERECYKLERVFLSSHD